MASKSSLSYSDRVENHTNPVAKKLFSIAASKQSNLMIRDDQPPGSWWNWLTNRDIASRSRPTPTSSRTSVTIQSAASNTAPGYKILKFVDSGNTMQKQYYGGALRISESGQHVLASDGTIEAWKDFCHRGEWVLLILAKMATKGSLAIGDYTKTSIELAKRDRDFVVGFVASRALTGFEMGE
ncbi:orotidine 5'-phosphate decarboxylase [Trapelia coarctata]|nr:orotidine 5'-phosphate decarboxylase [Trapelia coarctata]